MRRKIIVMFLIGFTFPCFSQSIKEEITLVTEDISRFWKAYDLAKPDFKATFFRKYLEDGSPGLKDFTSTLKSRTRLAKAIRKNQKNYEKIREASLNIKINERAKIEDAFQNLKKLYPNTICPDIYFVIGKMNVGSSISDNGIIIGYETISIMGNESLLPLIMHEAIHFQQNYNPNQEELLLGRCIKEGAANLISELVLGINKNFSHSNDDYAFKNERKLWKQFTLDRKRNKLKNWLYDGNALGDGPKHLGYWIGYQIVKEFYLKSSNKKQAIWEILNINDFNVFLEQSGFY